VIPLAVAFAVLPFVLPLIGSTLGLANEIVIYTLYAVGFNLLLGYTGLVSFGASAYFGVASYAAGLAFLHFGIGVVPSVVFGTVFSGLLGLALGTLILRRRGIYFSLLTLAFTQLFYEIGFTWTDFTGGENGLQGITRPTFTDQGSYYVFSAVVVTAAVYATWRLVHSPFGRVLQAIRDNERRTRCLGYDTQRYKLGAFVLSSALIGLGGSLLTFLIRAVYADNLNWQHAGDPVMMTILGGIHHFLGPLWGSIIFIILRDQLSSVTEHWWLFFGAILIAFILLSPEGLSGIVARLTRGRRWSLTRFELPPRPARVTAPQRRQEAVAGGAAVLSVHGLKKRFGLLTVADGIELDLQQGELHSLIGPNGAGKTTFFNMLTGLVESDGGTITFQGRDITDLPAHQRIDAGLARSFQIVSVFRDLSVFETVRLAAQARSPWRASLWRNAYALPGVNEKAWALLDLVGLADRAGETCANLAHGEQRLLEIAVTLATEPGVLLLDEPLAGLGDADRERIGNLIRELAGEHTILLIEHDIDRVLSLSDRITVLHQGAVIAEGPPREIASHPEVMAAYLGRHGEARPAAPVVGKRSLRPAEPLLELDQVDAGYDASQILHGVSLRVAEGEVVALLGRNGVGKTTTLKTIIGTLAPRGGRIAFAGTETTGWSADRVNRLGISIVPEGRRIFPNLTVLENLLIAQRPGGWSVSEAYELFPKLKLRQTARGENLSGGERQMLAIARALMAPTRLMLLDEPFEGLAPSIVAEVLAAVTKLRDRTSILIVEQKIDLILQLADRSYIMVNGQIVHEGDARALRADEELQARLLGVGA
jgi:ABC-type branched-subunit amino acid transport system ATPase component/ABC-type branched-subunit amino acid transport system permease subunit